MTLATTDPAGTLANLQTATPVVQAPAAVVQIHEWAAELSAAHQLASALAHSSFLPMALRQKGKNNFKNIDELTNDTAAVILAGKSVGMDPMQAVQNIFPVHGMPSMYARSMAALVMSYGHELMRGEAADESVTWHARRKGQKDWQPFTWTIQRATKAGYTSNAKYKSDPIGMLSAKALAEACRVVFPDVLLGMAYSVEDLELDPDATDTGDVPAPEPEKPKTKVQRKPRKSQVPEPVKPTVVEEQTPEAPEPEPEPETTEPEQAEESESMITREQWSTISAALDAVEVTDSAEKLATIGDLIGREIARGGELTEAEASEVIANLGGAKTETA